MSESLKKLVQHYRALDAQRELELCKALYRCLLLRSRLPSSPLEPPAAASARA
jgi:hypothetical protein